MTRNFKSVMTAAAEAKASDVLIIIEAEAAKISMRVDGKQKDMGPVSREEAKGILNHVAPEAMPFPTPSPDPHTLAARVSKQEMTLPEGIQHLRMQYNARENGNGVLNMRLEYAPA